MALGRPTAGPECWHLRAELGLTRLTDITQGAVTMSHRVDDGRARLRPHQSPIPEFKAEMSPSSNRAARPSAAWAGARPDRDGLRV